MNCPSHFNEVVDQVDKYVEVWERLIEQLNKDLALVGLSDIELQTKITPKELWNGLQTIFSELMHQKTSRFIHLLYRIDIHEKEIQDLMRHDDFLERLVYRVVERSFQKIYWRSVYM
jgi:hypothetical protein